MASHTVIPGAQATPQMVSRGDEVAQPDPTFVERLPTAVVGDEMEDVHRWTGSTVAHRSDLATQSGRVW